MQIKLDKLGFAYQEGKWLFRNLDLTLSTGERVGLSAPSGKGKSSLAQIIAGYLEAREGSISIWRTGNEIMQSTSDALDKSRQEGSNPIQLIWQHPEKAVNPKWKLGRSLEEAGPIDWELLERLGVEKNWLDRWPNELSGGELQRICVARALQPGTKFIIADEMTTMLDAITQAQIWSVVLDLVESRKMGLMVISHDPKLLHRLCQRQVKL